MTKLLTKLFIKPDLSAEDIRFAYGKLAGGTGIACNILLFIAKLLIGMLSGSVAITADAFNNLSDAASSVVTLFGFKLSSAPPDRQHPFGHGRMEYISALGVAALIMIAGFELATSAIDKIIHPADTVYSVVTLAVLVLAIAVKLWLAVFYHTIGKRISSDALMASYADSRNDALCTAVVLVCALVSRFSGWQIDGYVGVLVAAFVLWSGFSVMRETVSPLLGQAPDAAFVKDITDTVLAHDGIVGIHDLIVHNYGPGRVLVSLHAEVPADTDILASHDVIDCIEEELMQRFRIIACIHMDPVDTENETTKELKRIAETVLADMNAELSLHDFRVVHGETHTNLIFDLVIPFELDKDAAHITAEIGKRIHAIDSHLMTVIKIEHSYI